MPCCIVWPHAITKVRKPDQFLLPWSHKDLHTPLKFIFVQWKLCLLSFLISWSQCFLWIAVTIRGPSASTVTSPSSSCAAAEGNLWNEQCDVCNTAVNNSQLQLVFKGMTKENEKLKGKGRDLQKSMDSCCCRPSSNMMSWIRKIRGWSNISRNWSLLLWLPKHHRMRMDDCL